MLVYTFISVLHVCSINRVVRSFNYKYVFVDLPMKGCMNVICKQIHSFLQLRGTFNPFLKGKLQSTVPQEIMASFLKKEFSFFKKKK